ncbi:MULTISPECIES: FAD-binding oxidoreductase [unclassified Aureimonas]|uniref:FAD-binding oxidoreductase n=1 Tax=unclassified Aureimonas TaxID=2615206 RepID=UPI0006FE066E|nr:MULTISPECIES: FAD-binding oxidoreductase [unclassified Aureimonas]KQT53916.1 hypothetical protein ASG62_11830 [Aureimonas sp. Leaf427]KQT71644.1 hypothetical protein ASG54_19330 [Aureimonas sp. Leaf460]
MSISSSGHPASRRLTGWGRTAHATTAVFEPQGAEAVAARLAAEAGARGLIAFGAGRSYGDVALNDGGETLLSAGLDAMAPLGSDGLLVCGPGVTFRQVIETHLADGWAMPVSPGTAFATVAGAIANDVHGKNHDRAGSFGDHVEWMSLALPGGRIARISPSEEPDLFRATIGGLGLTGIIVEAAIRLKRVASSDVVMREDRAGDISALMAGLREGRERATYTVAWIDAVARGRHLGRGILQTAETAPSGLRAPATSKARRLPVDLPAIALNHLSIGLFNELYYRRVPSAGRERLTPLTSFLYPLDALLDWNRMYGRRGFYQFQCVLPEEASDIGIPKLLEAIAADGSGSFLAVLKTLGGEGRGLLSFPLRGFTLALDFPARRGTPDLMRRLERLTLDHGGRIYLAKDACLSPQGFRRMYPGHPRFREIVEAVDPKGVFASDLSRRLRLREA